MTAADWTDFAHTGPGTLAGRYLRMFWQPVARAQDLPPGRALPVRIMSEDFTLYRGEGARPHPARLAQAAPPSPIAMGEGDRPASSPAAAGEGGGEDGKPHAVSFRCAHRGTQLSTGWVEGENIRCFYHGWTYDPSGQCVEQPAEPEPFCEKIRIRSYPTREYIGLIFVYFGASSVLDPSSSGPQPVSPPDRKAEPPELPRYPEFEDPTSSREVLRADWPCNCFQRIENSPDIAHIAFVHRQEGRGPSIVEEATETDCAIEVQARYPNGVLQRSHLELPNISKFRIPARPGDDSTNGRDNISWRVAIDDERHVSFSVNVVHWKREEDALAAASRPSANGQEESLVAQLGEAVLAGNMAILDVMQGPYSPNLVMEVQDYVAMVAQGASVDRSHERLGRSDLGVILLRKVWSREMRAVAEGRPLKNR